METNALASDLSTQAHMLVTPFSLTHPFNSQANSNQALAAIMPRGPSDRRNCFFDHRYQSASCNRRSKFVKTNDHVILLNQQIAK
jgi:hypothetical protein